MHRRAGENLEDLRCRRIDDDPRCTLLRITGVDDVSPCGCKRVGHD
jgi:hypothetical protein